MSDNLMGYAVERLREATANRDTVLRNVVDDGRAEATEAAQIARTEDANRETGATRRGIENGAIGVLGEVFNQRCDYRDVVEAIKLAEADWLYPVLLDRALDAVGGDA